MPYERSSPALQQHLCHNSGDCILTAEARAFSFDMTVLPTIRDLSENTGLVVCIRSWQGPESPKATMNEKVLLEKVLLVAEACPLLSRLSYTARGMMTQLDIARSCCQEQTGCTFKQKLNGARET